MMRDGKKFFGGGMNRTSVGLGMFLLLTKILTLPCKTHAKPAVRRYNNTG